MREYALFTPREGAPSALRGYRRGAVGNFVPWQPHEQGRLWSAVLGRRRARDVCAEEARRRAEAEAEQLRRELDRGAE